MKRLGFLLAATVVLTLVGISSLSGAEPDVEYVAGTFSDDNNSSHEENIEAIAAAGVTAGCDDELYCPNDLITRAQFATFLDRALDLPDSATDFFTDDDGNVHEAAINNVAEAEITLGCTATLFCPQDNLTRAQMATLLVRALDGLLPADDDYFTDDENSSHQANINIIATNGITLGCAPGLYCPNDAVARDRMASFLARALELDPIPVLPVLFDLELVVSGLTGGTTDLQAPPGDDRLFLVERVGTISIIENGAVLPTPFLDLTSSVLSTVEEGMLGMAFHPDFDSNRKVYVFYSDVIGDSQVYEYLVDATDPNVIDTSTARHIITFEQRITSPTHKAGQLQFGPDGYLYIAVGDGGGTGDPFEHGEDPMTELGTIIRIDVDSGDPYAIPPDNPFVDGVEGLPEVWAFGLRNPWRFSIDSDYIYIADVGRLEREEVNVISLSSGGTNFGWDTMEGSICHEPVSGCDTTGLFMPTVEYTHDEGNSVIGGYVYRGSAIPELVGTYVYADLTGGWLRSFVYDGGVTDHYDWSRAVDAPLPIWSLGVDGHGELYVLAGTSVYKIVPSS